jgi:hypothetical protein
VIGTGIKWVFDRFDRHQKEFIAALKDIQDREEVRRKQHLDDTRTYAESLRDLAAQVRADSRRPPPGSR